MSDRVSSYGIANSTAQMLTQLHSDVQKAGFHADGNIYTSFGDIGGRVGQSVNYEAIIDKLEVFQTRNPETGSRLQFMEGKISSLRDIATKFRNLMMSSINSVRGRDNEICIQAQNMLQQAQDILNSQYCGEFIFGGTETGSSPVDYQIPEALLNDINAPGNFDYYNGNSIEQKYQVDENTYITCEVNASNCAFEEIMRSMALVISSPSSIPDNERLTKALNLANTSISGLSGLGSKVAAYQTSLDAVNKDISNRKLYYTQTLGEMISPKPEEAITKFVNLQRQLEIAMMIESRLSGMSLLNYLK